MLSHSILLLPLEALDVVVEIGVLLPRTAEAALRCDDNARGGIVQPIDEAVHEERKDTALIAHAELEQRL